MSENVAAEASPGDQLRIVADALESAVETAKNGAVNAKATVEGALPAASRFLSRFVYTTTYTVSYGIVFPTILIAKSIPTNNPLAHGFIDGARAASERADQLKTSETVVAAGRCDAVASLVNGDLENGVHARRDRLPWCKGPELESGGGLAALPAFFQAFPSSRKYTLISIGGLGLASGDSWLGGTRRCFPVFVEDRGDCMPSQHVLERFPS